MTAEPEYIERLRASSKFADKTRLQIELRLVNTPGIEKLTGKTAHQHRLEARSLMFPSRLENPWGERLFAKYQSTRDRRIKELMTLGSSNSSKTSTLADLALVLWYECPEATSIYLASPYEDATETGLWARILEQFDEAKSNNPELPGKLKPSENKIVLYENNPLSFLKVVTIDQVGKLVGKKSKNFNVGMMILIADELPEFKQSGRALIKVMNNLISVPNMMLIGAGNFANPNDALGKFAEPAIPGGYNSLRVDEHYEWPTVRGGTAIRFDGDQSPGLEDPKKYFFLPKADDREQLAKQSGGKKSADYYRFWHSFPLVGSEEFTVTNLTKIRQSGALLENYEWTADTIIKGSHCDPGFGGDPAVIQDWRLGKVKTEKGKIQVIEGWGQPITVPIDVTLNITPEEQVVLFHKAHAEEMAIPEGNCSFDGSMRASIVQEYGRSWSWRVHSIDGGGKATDRPTSPVAELGGNQKTKEPPKFSEKVCNFSTEMWWAAAMLFMSGQVRGLGPDTETPLIQQLCKRVWKWESKKRKLESKKQFKANNAGKSPNEADAWCGAVEMARRRGLSLNGVAYSGGNGSLTMLQQLHREKQLRAQKAELSHTRQLQGGALRATKAATHSTLMRHSRP